MLSVLGKTTNELKSGTRIELANGWRGTIEDNARGNIRMCLVEGVYTELGSVYAHNIAYYLEGEGNSGVWYKVRHTPKQIKLRKALGH